MLLARFLGDAAVVRRILSGHTDEYKVLVERHVSTVRALAFAHLGNHADADDATQESFIKAYQSLNALRQEERFGAWLAAIVRNTCKRMRMQQTKDAKRLADAFDGAEPMVVPDVEQRDMHETVRRIIMGLDETSRETLLLHYFAQQSTTDIARTLNISNEAAKKRLQRARETLGNQIVSQVDRILGEPKQPAKNSAVLATAALQTTPEWLQLAHRPETALLTVYHAIGGSGLMKLAIAISVAAIGVYFLGPAERRPASSNAEPGGLPAEMATERSVAISQRGAQPSPTPFQPAASATSNEPESVVLAQAHAAPASPDTSRAAWRLPGGSAGGNPQHSNTYNAPGLRSEPSATWTSSVEGNRPGDQVVRDGDGNLYLTCRVDSMDRMFSYDRQGNLRWKSEPVSDGYTLSIPALTPGGLVVAGFRDNTVRAFETTNGVQRWVRELGDAPIGLISSPTVDRQGNVYIGGNGTRGFAKLDGATGDIIWERLLPQESLSDDERARWQAEFGSTAPGSGSSPSLSHDEQTVYIGHASDEVALPASDGLYALNSSDGSIKWRFHSDDTDHFWVVYASPFVGTDGTIYQQVQQSSVLYALTDAGDRAIVKWTYNPAEPGDAPRLAAVDDQSVYLSTNPATMDSQPVLCALTLDGDLRWFKSFPGAYQGNTPVVASDAVYAWTAEQPSPEAGLLDRTGQSAQDGTFLYAFDKTSGELLWRRQLSTHSQSGDGMTLTPDGSIVLAMRVNSDSGTQVELRVLAPGLH